MSRITALPLDDEPVAFSLFDDDDLPEQMIIRLNPDSPYSSMAWSDLYGMVVDGFKVVGIEDRMPIGSGIAFERELALVRA